MENTVTGMLKTATVDTIVVNARSGPVPAFLLSLVRQDAHGQEMPEDQFVVSPEQISALCSLLQETLHAAGHAVPHPPTSELPQH